MSEGAEELPISDRRSGPRAATVFRPVLIETEEFAGFCLVRNLSAEGMMGEVYTSFAEEQPITVQFGDDTVVSGTIRWCQNGSVGVQFDTAVEVEEILAAVSKSIEGRVNRAPRLQIRCFGRLTFADGTAIAEVQDISQRGIRVRAPLLQPGDEVGVQLEGLEQRKAVVRWTQGGMAGLNFLRPLAFDQLAQWVVDHHAGSWRARQGVEQPQFADGGQGWQLKLA